MSHERQENQGTGLRDIFDILVKEPPERLLSLTIQLGESSEDNIIHAFCLIILNREAQALEKLQTLTDNYLANHLAKGWKKSEGKLEDFGVHCGHFQEFEGESLAVLARIFKVLSQQRLCDPFLRNLAYQRALSTESQHTSSCDEQEYDPLREEAKEVCGPQAEEWFCSPRGLRSESYHDHQRSLVGENTTLDINDICSDRDNNLPSPLQASSSMPSYPTHLEISIPPTLPYSDNKTPETSHRSDVCVLIEPGPPLSSVEPQPKSNQHVPLEAKEDSKTDAAAEAACRKSTKEKFALPTPTVTCVPKVPLPNEMYEYKGPDAEEEVTFYAFVILHAQEDADIAESMKEKLESVACCTGATFSEDFAIPGKSTLRCVEDAINNSAYTLLLFTRNFNNELLEMKTDTALVNSINKKYKHNTVVPLLPRENCMPKENMPMVVRRIIPLEEGRSFEKKIKKFLSPALIERQRRIWTEVKRVQHQIERQEDLQRLNQCQKKLIQECKKAELQERKNLNLSLKLLGREQQGSIHIENANYIMIGDSSKMNVDHGGHRENNDSHSPEEEQ